MYWFRWATSSLAVFFLSQSAQGDVEVLLTTIDTVESRLEASQLNFDSVEQRSSIVISVDREKTFQTMLGYGGAMTDASAAVLLGLKSTNPEGYAKTMRQLFSPKAGAGFSFFRLPMGASDYVATDRYYTFCDQPSPTLEGFSIERDQKFVIPVLKDALALQPKLQLIATPWSAPAWMKTNGKLDGVTPEEKAKGATARLKPQYFELYAEYFVKFLQAYRAEGIEIHSLTLQNEPQNDLSDYPCMRMDAAEQIRLVKLLAPKMKAANFKTKIFIHDHNWTLHKNDREVIGGDEKMEPFESVVKMFSDPEVSEMIAGSAWHCYAGGSRMMEETYDSLQKRFPNKLILTTEISAWGLNRGAWWGDVEWGMAHVWLRPQLNGSAGAIQWNLALNHEAGPTLRDDSEAIGLITIDTNQGNAVTFEREFYAMAQLSRAAQPGAKRITASGAGERSGGLDLIAFETPDKKTSLVVFNRNGDGRSFQVSEGEHRFSYEVPGHSVVTFVW